MVWYWDLLTGRSLTQGEQVHRTSFPWVDDLWVNRSQYHTIILLSYTLNCLPCLWSSSATPSQREILTNKDFFHQGPQVPGRPQYRKGHPVAPYGGQLFSSLSLMDLPCVLWSGLLDRTPRFVWWAFQVCSGPRLTDFFPEVGHSCIFTPLVWVNFCSCSSPVCPYGLALDLPQ